jgi:hypothetical protein
MKVRDTWHGCNISTDCLLASVAIKKVKIFWLELSNKGIDAEVITIALSLTVLRLTKRLKHICQVSANSTFFID